MTDELTEVLPQFCPSCGAGVENPERPPGTGILFRLPCGWPVSPPCPECARRDRVRAMQAGARMAADREKQLIAAILGDE